MKKLLTIMILAILLSTVSGCIEKKPEDPKPEEKVSYSDYQIWPVEYPKGFVSPDVDAEYASYQKALEAFELRQKDEEANTAFNSMLAKFNLTMMKTLLSEGKDNMVFSPVNLYFNLAMLASITQGFSRDELINLLAIDPDTLVQDYQRIWNDNTLTGKDTVSFANSIWFSDLLKYKEDAVKKIAADFYAPVFRGDTGSKQYSAAFRSWINDNTGKLLENEVSELEFDKEVRMALASTIYYKSTYLSPYVVGKEKAVFHGTSGDQKSVMMHKSMSAYYIDNDLFSGFIEELQNENMLLIMPKEGVSFKKMLEDEKFIKAVFGEPENSFDIASLRITLPPFDATSKVQLKDTLLSLGITGIFGDDLTAFSQIADNELYVSSMEHACRVKADENGVEAAAYTVEMMKETAMYPQEIIDIRFDRPFMFIIRSNLDNTILFCGTIRNV